MCAKERGHRECRVPVAPAASCKKTRVVATGTPGSTRHSLRNGLNGFLRALLGDRALLPPSPAEISSTNLMPASGHQDHTTSPYAESALVSRTTRVHRIPCPTFVTIAKRPSFRARDGAGCAADLGARSTRLAAADWHDGRIGVGGIKRMKAYWCSGDGGVAFFLQGQRGSRRYTSPHLAPTLRSIAPARRALRRFRNGCGG
jgi:hypothetical protein